MSRIPSRTSLPQCARCGRPLAGDGRFVYTSLDPARGKYAMGWHFACSATDALFRQLLDETVTASEARHRIRARGPGRVTPA